MLMRSAIWEFLYATQKSVRKPEVPDELGFLCAQQKTCWENS